jgi:hypothetical protein
VSSVVTLYVAVFCVQGVPPPLGVGIVFLLGYIPFGVGCFGLLSLKKEEKRKKKKEKQEICREL